MPRDGEVIWCRPEDIEYKISPFLDLGSREGGDWDIERRHPFKDTAKYRAIVQRFGEGRGWLETDLFFDNYTRRLKRDGRIGSFRALEPLAEHYEKRFCKLYNSMKANGFLLETKRGKKISLPFFLMGRDGDVFIGNQGNHRLAMARVLGLEKIAGKVVCKHTDLA